MHGSSHVHPLGRIEIVSMKISMANHVNQAD